MSVATNCVELFRAGYGLLQIVAADAIVTRVLHGGPDSLSRAGLRVLGARHLAQAIALTGDAGRTAHRLGGAVDAVHTMSMFALAALGSPRRAAIDGGVAAAFAIIESRRR